MRNAPFVSPDQVKGKLGWLQICAGPREKNIMNEQQRQFLSLVSNGRAVPARFNVEQTAWVLGFQEHDIPFLIRDKLLKPLGNPAKSGQKLFSAVEILELAQDRGWLSRATNAVRLVWVKKNEERGKNNGHDRRFPDGTVRDSLKVVGKK